MTKPKITILTDWYLPGTRAGGPVRSLSAMIELLKDHYDFYVITRHTDLGSKEPYHDVEADKLIESEGVHYFYFRSESLSRDAVRRLILFIGPDLVYLN